MAGYKNGKIMLPIKEFLIVKGQATYELNTIDMTKVTVFYRKYNQEAFLETYSEMPKGDYRINEVGGNKQLEITNLDILDKYYSIQLCRVVDLTSSPYNPSGRIDVITLTQHVNELVADVQFIFTYLKDVGMVMDSSAGNKILAELKPRTTWYMDENGNMAAMPVNDLFKHLDLITKYANEKIEELKRVGEEQINNLLAIASSIKDQQYYYVLPKGQTTITLPSVFKPTGKTRVFANGLLLSPDKNYTLSNGVITLNTAYETNTDIFINDNIPEGTVVEIDTIDKIVVNVDRNTGVPTATATFENRILTIDFKNLKGEDGRNGRDGVPGQNGKSAFNASGHIQYPNGYEEWIEE